VGARFSAPVQTDPGAHTASCTMGTGSFPGAKSGQGLLLTTHPLLVPWSRKRRAIPLLPLWAVRPVQSLSACTRVHFTFYYLYIPTGVSAGLDLLRYFELAKSRDKYSQTVRNGVNCLRSLKTILYVDYIK